jgi:hypothetical protein
MILQRGDYEDNRDAIDEIDALLDKALRVSIEAFGEYKGNRYMAEVTEIMSHHCLQAAPKPKAPGYQKNPIHPRIRKQVWERDGYRCQNCGGWSKLSTDHIVPESKGGTTTLDNLQTLCKSCNSKKGNRV